MFRHSLTKRWIKVERVREQHQQDIIGGTPWETVTFTSLGMHSFAINVIVNVASQVFKLKYLIHVCKCEQYKFVGNQKDLFLNIVDEARNEALLQTEGKTVTYVSPNSGSNDWRQFGNAKDKRSLKSVILGKGLKEKIVNDAEEFIKNSQWYKDREIPYRRGYLLHGPPGRYIPNII